MEIRSLAAVLLFSLMTAGLGMFFQVCQEKGMIFRKYRNWIKYRFIVLPHSKNCFSYDGLYKILGGCIYCNGTWIAILFYLICFYDTFDVRLLLLCIGSNYLWIELWLKIKE
jgi:hypothetical protein